MFRLLTNEVYWDGIINGYSIVTYSCGIVKIEPFEKELHSTVFVPGPIALLDSSKFDEFIVDDIEMNINVSSGMIMDKNRLNEFFYSSSLYFKNGDKTPPVFLKIGKNCQIIPIN